MTNTSSTAAGSLAAVVIVSPGDERAGGMGTVTRVLAGWLQLHRPEIELCVLDSRGNGPAWRFAYHFAGAAIRLLGKGRSGSGRVLHLQVSERASFIRKGLLLELGRVLGYRTILHHHGAELIPFYASAPSWMQKWVKHCVLRCDINIVLGDHWKTFLLAEAGVPSARVAVLHNAIDDLGFAANRPAASETHFLLMANLSPRKGVGEFLLALRDMRDAGVNVRATLAGGGEVERYRSEAEALGLSSITNFTGWVDRAQVIDLLHTVDALVLPSYEEGLPMVILEALSAGLPVIATPVGSIPDLLSDGKDCLFVPVGDIAGLQAVLTRVAADPELRRGLAVAGRELFERAFNIDAYMVRLLALYRQVL